MSWLKKIFQGSKTESKDATGEVKQEPVKADADSKIDDPVKVEVTPPPANQAKVVEMAKKVVKENPKMKNAVMRYLMDAPKEIISDEMLSWAASHLPNDAENGDSGMFCTGFNHDLRELPEAIGMTHEEEKAAFDRLNEENTKMGGRISKAVEYVCNSGDQKLLKAMVLLGLDAAAERSTMPFSSFPGAMRTRGGISFALGIGDLGDMSEVKDLPSLLKKLQEAAEAKKKRDENKKKED